MQTPPRLPMDSLAGGASQNITPDLFGSSVHHLDQQISPHPPAVHRPRAFPFPGVPPSNVMDLDRIECGSDPRTTCMIKVSAKLILIFCPGADGAISAEHSKQNHGRDAFQLHQ